MTVEQAWSLLLQGSPVVLTAGLWAVVTGRLVPRYVYDDLRKDRDEWKHRFEDAMHIAKRSVDDTHGRQG